MLIGGAVVIALGAFAALGGPKELRDRTWPKRWGTVDDGVFRSGQLHHALVHETLREHRIAVIVDLTRENPDDSDERAEAEAIRRLGITLQRFPMQGNGTGDLDRVAGAVAAVESARRNGKPVLVHCNSGVQRTGCVAAIYDLLLRGRPPGAVLDELQSYGWDPAEHRVLSDFINDNLAAIAERLQRLGVITEVPRPLPRLSPAED